MSYRMPSHAFITGQLRERCEAHNAEVAEWESSNAKLMAMRKSILDTDPLDVDPASLSSTREKLNADRLASLQHEAKIAESAVSLLDDVRAVAAKSEKGEAANAEKVLAKVLEGMAKLGHTVESQQAWPNNPNAAKHQLEYQGKQSTDYKAAKAAAEDAKQVSQAILDQRRTLNGALDAIRDDAKRLIEMAVGELQLA